jgi:methionyl-tRNA synthetase
MAKKYITTPIYYVTAKPHVGHAYTTLAADVIARYFRKQKEDVYFLTGTDEHGAKVASYAKKEGKDFQEYVDEISLLYKKTWKNLNITNDDFIRTTEKRHERVVREVFEKLKEKGDLYQGEYRGLYCEGCEGFITEKDLVDGKCPYHKKEPEEIVEKNWFFRLENYLGKIKENIEKDILKIEPQERKKEVLGLFRQKLEDFSVSREKVEWGIKVPFDEQVVYVWVDALLNYISAIGYEGEGNFKKWWPADLQLIGKEILKFHAVYWPAILLALGLALPKKIFMHGFFSVDGQKMSKTLGNVIDPNDLVEKYGRDAARYLILSQFPFGADGDVKAANFLGKYNSDLANGLGNLVSRVLAMIEKGGSEEILKLTISKIRQKEIERIRKDYREFMEKLELDKALDLIKYLAKVSDEKIEKEKPWELKKRDENRMREVLRDLWEVVILIGDLIEPFMPETTLKISKMVENGRILKKENLFPRIKN